MHLAPVSQLWSSTRNGMYNYHGSYLCKAFSISVHCELVSYVWKLNADREDGDIEMKHHWSFWAMKFCVIHQNIQLEGTMLCDWNAFIQYQFCEGKD